LPIKYYSEYIVSKRNFLLLVLLFSVNAFLAGALNWFGPFIAYKTGGAPGIALTYSQVLILAALSHIVGGALTDTLGRKRTAIFAASLRLLVTFILLVEVNVYTAMLFIISYEILRFFIHPPLSVLLYESVKQEVYGRVLAMFRLLTLAMNIAGAMLIGVLFERGAYIEALLIASIATLIIVNLVEETYQPPVSRGVNLGSLFREFILSITRGLNVVLRNPRLRNVFIVASIMEFTGFLSWLYIPSLLTVRGLTASELGFVFSVATAARSLGVTLSGFLADRYGVYKLIILECVTSAPLWYIIAVVDDPYIIAVAFILNELLIASSTIPIRRTFMIYAPQDSRGVVSSMLPTFTALTSSASPILGGLLFSINISLPYLITGTVWAAIAILILITKQKD